MVLVLASIKIDFAQSHLFFPRIIIGILIGLAIIMAIKYLPNKIREIKEGQSKKFFVENYDKFKLYSTIVLIALYFKGMEWIGSFFPNMGYGFLIVSIIFMLSISILFIGEKSKKKLLFAIINSLATPILAWYIFGILFHISLP